MSLLLSPRALRVAPPSFVEGPQGLTQVRHKPPSRLLRPRELVLACAPLQSHANFSTIVRMAGNCGVSRIVACGSVRVAPKVARDAVETVRIEARRSLCGVLDRLRDEGYELVALEQTTRSESLHGFGFERKTALVVGSERAGLDDAALRLADRIAEIPVYGLPHSYNAATAAILGMYEYCRCFPQG